MSNLQCDYSSASAITVQSSRVSITNCEFQHNRGFGILADKTAKDFSFKENHGEANGIEIIAATHGASNGEIANNRLVGSGDNGISISGDHVRVSGNIVKSSLAHGIAVYGDYNTVTDNQVIDNAQVDNPHAPAILLWNNTRKAVYHSPGYSYGGKNFGIKIEGAFGGHGSHNTVVNNVVVDNQPKPTQGGITIGPNSPDNIVANNKVGRHRQ
jgi:parallel beta-helix repeat protein